MSEPSADVLIVGAGIVGAACAFELARDGRRVHVLDAGSPGGGTTAAGMGHVVVMDGSETELAFTRFARRLWDELAPELPAAAEREVRGTLWIAADAEELAVARSKSEVYAAHGVESEVVDEGALRAAEPRLRHGLAGGLRVPGDSIVYPPAVVGWLLEWSGARVESGAEAVRVREGVVLLADGSRREAEWVVDAAGLGALDLLDQPPAVPVRPRKGHLAITDRYPGFVHHQLVELGYLESAHGASAESVAFNVQPRATGQLLIGSSRQQDRGDAAVEPAMLGRMLRRALEFLPDLGVLKITRTWTGLRPATADKLPLIGPLASAPRLVVAAGHEGLGITTALATGRLVADLVAGRESEIDREPFRPDRSPGHA